MSLNEVKPDTFIDFFLSLIIDIHSYYLGAQFMNEGNNDYFFV